MLDNRYDLTAVLAAYPAECRPICGATPVTNGFSGSRMWRLDTAGGTFCLRRWPAEYPDSTQLQSIHRVLEAVFVSGFTCVPRPIFTVSGETFVRHQEHLWDLAPWLPGEPDDDQTGGETTSVPRIEAALTAIAQFHRAVASDAANRFPDAPAPGLIQRLEELKSLQAGNLERLIATIAENAAVWPELAQRSTSMIELYCRAAPRVASNLEGATRYCVPILPCIRDIHRQHVLFQGAEVTGIVDFGAMRPDNVSCDIARLLGSMALDDVTQWRIGMSAYELVRPLSGAERRLVNAYDESGVLLSGIHWLQWIFIDGRMFDDRAGVLSRFDAIAARLANLANRPAAVVV